MRANGVHVRRQPAAAAKPTGATLGYGQDRPHGMVQAAVQGLKREGLPLRELSCGRDELACRWAKSVAECLARGECAGGVLFCEDPGLVACVANKVPGLRAVGVTTVAQAVGRRIVTLEGLGSPEKPHPLQRAFIREQAAQCGYCGNGMIMKSKELLDRAPTPSEPEIRQALAGNLCRCGTHNNIIRAVRRAAREIKS